MEIEGKKRGSLFGAALLVSGTCIGGGILALPVVTSLSGFFPSLAFMVLCWAFMTLTGLLFVEANLWMEEGAHITTMASRLLGKFGKYLSASLYVFMAYASLIAYNAGGGEILSVALSKIFGLSFSHMQACIVFTLLFGLMVYFGAKLIGRINAILVIAMIVSYIALIGVSVEEIKIDYLLPMNWGHSFTTMPIIFTTFSYQFVVPSLTPYLQRDPQRLRKAIIYGTSIPFIGYTLWQCITLGQIPVEGEFGLAQTLERGSSVVEALRNFTANPLLTLFSEYFAFFALVTSYLGISLGLYDFLSDGLKIKKKGFHGFLLGSLVVIPALLLTLLYPNAFILFLELSGGFGDAILNGLIPVAMVWIGRYVKCMEGPYQVLGGKWMLTTLLAVAVLVFVIQFSMLFH